MVLLWHQQTARLSSRADTAGVQCCWYKLSTVAQEGQASRTMQSVSRSTSTHSVRMLNAPGAPGYLQLQRCHIMRDTYIGRPEISALLKSFLTASEVTEGSAAIPLGHIPAPAL